MIGILNNYNHFKNFYNIIIPDNLDKIENGIDNHDNDKKEDRDQLIDDYDSILRESALLTTVSGILFGFFT